MRAGLGIYTVYICIQVVNKVVDVENTQEKNRE